MATAYIAIGSNKGKRIKNIKEALVRIREEMRVEKTSSLYLTEPMELKGGWFVNCVLEAKTDKEPEELVRTLLKIEEKMGRIRIKEKKIPRVIDLDLLFYEERIMEEKDLILPHPSLHKRGFVLIPLNEINPDLYHPVLKKSVKEILQSLTDIKQVERIIEG